MPESLKDLTKHLSDLIRAKGLTLATAESCTGGLIAAAITDLSGSSAIFDRGFITYSNEAKTEMLGVPPDTIQTHGAVSPQCAAAMAQGALKNSNADITISVTGIAGPDGGTPDKPIGTVFIGVAKTGHDPKTHHLDLQGNRDTIRQQTCAQALQLLIKDLS